MLYVFMCVNICVCKREQRGKGRERVNVEICSQCVLKDNKEPGLIDCLFVCLFGNLITGAEDCHEFKAS